MEDKTIYQMVGNMIVQLPKDDLKWLFNNVYPGFIAGSAIAIRDGMLTISEWKKLVKKMRTLQIENNVSFNEKPFSNEVKRDIL